MSHNPVKSWRGESAQRSGIQIRFEGGQLSPQLQQFLQGLNLLGFALMVARTELLKTENK